MSDETKTDWLVECATDLTSSIIDILPELAPRRAELQIKHEKLLRLAGDLAQAHERALLP